MKFNHRISTCLDESRKQAIHPIISHSVIGYAVKLHKCWNNNVRFAVLMSLAAIICIYEIEFAFHQNDHRDFE